MLLPWLPSNIYEEVVNPPLALYCESEADCHVYPPVYAALPYTSFYVSVKANRFYAFAKKVIQSKFKSANCVQISPALLSCELHLENLFGRRFVRVTLAIVAYDMGRSSSVTVMGTAYGRNSLRRPGDRGYSDPIDGDPLFQWLSYAVVPLLQSAH